MKADEQTESAVMAVLNTALDAHAARDMDCIVALFAPDRDVLVIASGPDERNVGLTEIKAMYEREWSHGEAISFELGWHSVSSAGSVAWVASDIIVHTEVEGQEMHLPARLTAVLERRGDEWLFVQLHGSLPAAGQADGAA